MMWRMPLVHLIVFGAGASASTSAPTSASTAFVALRAHPRRDGLGGGFCSQPTASAWAPSTALSSSHHDGTDTNVITEYNATTIAGHTFRRPTNDDLETIQERQLFHPLQPEQMFCVSTNLCKHGHPQAFGFHPTHGPKLVSGLFRLSCPLLCQAIDEYEGEGGVRQMTDWLRTADRTNGKDWKREGYERANEMQKSIRMELAKDDRDKLVDRMGEFNAQRFLESGVAGIPAAQTYNVKCVHAHVADHLCRRPSSSDVEASANGPRSHAEEGNVIGKEALRNLEERGVEVAGNDVCWQQCNKERCGTSDWRYVPKKNRQKLRSTRERRKQIQEERAME